MRPRRTAISAAWLLAAGIAAAQDGQSWGKRERIMKDNPLAQVDTVDCPVCGARVELLLSATVSEYEWDTDYMVTRANFNVYPYVLATCWKCSYTTYSAQFNHALTDEQRERVDGALKPIREPYPDYWSVPMAFSIRAGVVTQKALAAGEGTLFEIYLLGTYMARGSQVPEAEREMQRLAVQNLLVAVDKDEAYQRPKMRYLAGEIYRRLGQYKEALDWYGKSRLSADDDLMRLIQRQELSARDAMDKKDRKK